MMRKTKGSEVGIILLILVAVGVIAGCAERNKYDDLQAFDPKELKRSASGPAGPGKMRLGIAFGGGGTRGFAHLGVIKALNEAGIKADVVTGSSVGAIAAILYASGMTYPEIESAVMAVKPADVTDLVWSVDGKINGREVAEWVNQLTGNRDIQDLAIPVGVTVTDIMEGRSLLVTEGNTGRAAQASVTLPGMVIPVEAGGSLWIDGGLLSLVPVRYARLLGADIVIGVDVLCGGQLPLQGGREAMVYSVMRLQSCMLAEEEISEADYLVRPGFDDSLPEIYRSRRQAFTAGYHAGERIARLITDR